MYIIEVPYLSLDKIYESGQGLRWIKVRDCKYIVICGPKAVKVEQKKERFIFDCSEEEFINVWWNYFDLKNDYMDIAYNLRKIDSLIVPLINRATGIHIVKQDLFEVIIRSYIKFKISGFHGLQSIIDTICFKTGCKHSQAMRECGKVVWMEFPTADKLLKKSNCLSDFDVAGHKNEILQLCECVNDGWLNLDLLKSMPYDKAAEYLFDFLEDEKAVNEVMLYALHNVSVFPDNSVFSDLSLETGLSENELKEWLFEDNKWLEGNSGFLYQYLKYNKLCKPLDLSGGVSIDLPIL